MPVFCKKYNFLTAAYNIYYARNQPVYACKVIVIKKTGSLSCKNVRWYGSVQSDK